MLVQYLQLQENCIDMQTRFRNTILEMEQAVCTNTHASAVITKCITVLSLRYLQARKQLTWYDRVVVCLQDQLSVAYDDMEERDEEIVRYE